MINMAADAGELEIFGDLVDGDSSTGKLPADGIGSLGVGIVDGSGEFCDICQEEIRRVAIATPFNLWSTTPTNSPLRPDAQLKSLLFYSRTSQSTKFRLSLR